MKVKDQPDHPIVDDLSPPAKRCARMYVISVLLGKGTSRNSVEHCIFFQAAILALSLRLSRATYLLVHGLGSQS